MSTDRSPQDGYSIWGVQGPSSRFRFPVVAIVAILAACDNKVASAPSPQWEPRFLEVGTQTGVRSEGESWGLAVGDFDGDGWLDLFSGNHGRDFQLLRNLGSSGFADATSRIAGSTRSDLHGAAWADFDNDGDQDLLVLTGA